MLRPHLLAVFIQSDKLLSDLTIQNSLSEFTDVEGGRDLHRLPLGTDLMRLWSNIELTLDPKNSLILGSEEDGYIHFQSNNEYYSFETDDLGLGQFYFVQSDWGVALCTEFEPLLPFLHKLSLDTESVFDFMSNGMTSGNKTLLINVQSSSPGTKLTIFKNGRVSLDTNPYVPSILNISIEAAADMAYDIVKSRVRKMVFEEGIKILALTGGSDTRLILSCFSVTERTQLKFWFDDRLAHSKLKTFLDKKIVQILEHKLSLDVIYGAPPVSVGSNSVRRRKNGLRTFNNDFRAWTCSGMFGGEILGGALFEEMGLTPDTDKAQFAVHQLFSAFMGTTHADYLWRHPHYFFYSRRTPFWTPKLLKLIISLPVDYYIFYRLYRIIFQRHANNLIQYPFNSPITSHGSPFQSVDGIPQSALEQINPPVQTTELKIHSLIEDTIGPKMHKILKENPNYELRARILSAFIKDSLGVD
jgi:hypothetical protein